jgi:hypothetical protein
MHSKTKTFLRTNLLCAKSGSSVFNRFPCAFNHCKDGGHMANLFRTFIPYGRRKFHGIAFCLDSKNPPKPGAANAPTGHCPSQGGSKPSCRLHSSAGNDQLYDPGLDSFRHIELMESNRVPSHGDKKYAQND